MEDFPRFTIEMYEDPNDLPCFVTITIINNGNEVILLGQDWNSEKYTYSDYSQYKGIFSDEDLKDIGTVIREVRFPIEKFREMLKSIGV